MLACKMPGWFYGFDTTFIFFSLVVEAGSVFCISGIVYSYGKAGSVCISILAEPVMKGKHGHCFQWKILEDACGCAKLCNR